MCGQDKSIFIILSKQKVFTIMSKVSIISDDRIVFIEFMPEQIDKILDEIVSQSDRAEELSNMSEDY